MLSPLLFMECGFANKIFLASALMIIYLAVRGRQIKGDIDWYGYQLGLLGVIGQRMKNDEDRSEQVCSHVGLYIGIVVVWYFP